MHTAQRDKRNVEICSYIFRWYDNENSTGQIAPMPTYKLNVHQFIDCARIQLQIDLTSPEKKASTKVVNKRVVKIAKNSKVLMIAKKMIWKKIILPSLKIKSWESPYILLKSQTYLLKSRTLCCWVFDRTGRSFYWQGP